MPNNIDPDTRQEFLNTDKETKSNHRDQANTPDIRKFQMKFQD